MLYKIRCDPMHPFYGALPEPYVPVRVTRGAVIAHRYTYAPPRCRTSQKRSTFIPLSVSLWSHLDDSVFDGVGLTGFQELGQCLFIGLADRSILSLTVFPFSSFYGLLMWGLGCGLLMWDWGFNSSLAVLYCQLFLIIIIIII